MKRISVMLLAATAALTAAVGAYGSHDAEPACADIVGTSGFTFNSATGTVGGSFSVEAASCELVMYTLHVVYVKDGKTKEASSVARGDGNTNIFFSEAPAAQGRPVKVKADPSTSVCVYATTSSMGSELDRAPDAPNCVEVPPDGSGGGGGAFD
jgi:hypothetical protein